MANNNKWGQLTWSAGDWGLQEPVTEGWGAYGYGLTGWGNNFIDVTVSLTGQSLTTSLNSVTVTAEINRGWGRLTWGSLPWGAEITNVTMQF
jgi:hypothetical protein